jgi:DNA-binding PadR family transcriptional regulator
MSKLSLEFALLGFLLEKPCHGYDLHQKFKKELGSVWRASQSQVYATLKRLEKRGEISSTLVTQKKLPPRQILKITASGKIRFEKWLNETSRNSRAIRLEFLTRLYFCQKYTPERTATIYAAQAQKIQVTLNTLEKRLHALPPEQIYNKLSLDLRLRQIRLMQDWMQEIKTIFHIP